MRVFIGLPLSAEIKHTLKAIQDELQSCHLNAKWIPMENMHITLKFIGEIDELMCEQIIPVVTKTASVFSPLIINMEGHGFFPTARNPRVFFISTDHVGALTNMADYLENELEKIGIKKERRFKSHITLARFRSKKNVECVERKMNLYLLKGNFPVSEIILLKSTLSSRGAHYETLFTANLST